MSPRIIATLYGDPDNHPEARTKYSLLFKALAQRLELVDVIDVKLKGRDRLRNALISFYPDRTFWRERFYKNPAAFRWRSERLAARLRPSQVQADVVFQLGALFDSAWPPSTIPVVIYTDYTAALSARKPGAGRSPLKGQAQAQWLALERQAYQRAAHICVRSRMVQRSLIADYGLSPEQVTVVGGGVNFESFPEPGPVAEKGSSLALFIGKDFHRKGGPLLLEAFAEVQRRCPQARLLLVTAGPLPRPLPDGVDWLEPTWDRVEIAALYRRADFFVLPSHLETWGDVILEAMAFGLPCIGVDDDAMNEIILHKETGLLVPPDDAGSLADALLCFYTEHDLRRSLGVAGRQRALEQFLWPQVVARIKKLLEAAAK